MAELQPLDPKFEARVRASFARQAIMSTIGARLTRVAPGEVVAELPFRDDLTQQHGFLHAGIVATIVDSVWGYAALTLMPRGAAVLTAEYKVNLVASRSRRCLSRACLRAQGGSYPDRRARRCVRSEGQRREVRRDDARESDDGSGPRAPGLGRWQPPRAEE